MKKTLCIIFGMAAALMANDATVAELNDLAIMKENKINVLKVKDEGNIYFIKAEPVLAPIGQPKKRFTLFLTKDKKILMMGDAIYTDTKEKLSFPLDIALIKDQEVFTYGKGGKVLYVFVDPECPYCKLFEKKMETLKEKYTFKVFLLPLPFHPDAIPMSKWILKGKDNNEMGERLIAIANGSTTYKELVLTAEEDKRLTDTINSQIELAMDAEVKGTPTVLDSELNSVNWPSL